MTEEDPLEVFSSSLHSLFDHVVPANGDPLELFSYNPPTSNPRQPPLVCRIPPQQINSLFAHHVWNASLILADRISTSHVAGFEMDQSEEEAAEGGGMSVCELGCGAGIPGLIAARSPKVKRVVLTDYDDPLLIENLKGNIELAYKDDEPIQQKLRALGHTWGVSQSLAMILELNENKRYTHILMADTLWLTEAQTALVSSLTKLLAFAPSARIHLVAGFHSGRNAVRSFLRRAREAGLEEKEVEGKEWEELAVGGERRRWGWDLEGVEGDADWIDEKESNSERGKWVVVGEMGWSKETLKSRSLSNK